MSKRIVTVIMTILFVFLTGCSNEKHNNYIDTKRYSNINFKDLKTSSKDIDCENEKYKILWNDKTKQVEFLDKETNLIYSCVPSDARETVYDENGMIIRNNPLIESPITVYMYDPKAFSETTVLAKTSAIQDGEVYAQAIRNGIRVTYDFVDYEISVSVDYTISKDSFNISIDPKLISDNGKNFVTGVAIAPFICSLKNNSEDSYLFIPDGSGALIQPKSVDDIGVKGSFKVYGDDYSIQSFDLQSYNQKINMPIFGVKNNNTGVFGIITSGAEQSYINWNIGSDNLKYSAVYPFFRIRGYNLVKAPSGFAAASKEIMVFDKSIGKRTFSVSYYTLNGETANYNGMAEIYRNYLKENFSLNQKVSDEPVMAIKLLGALGQKEYTFGVPHKAIKPLTTIEETQEILEYIKKNITGNIVADMIGYGQSGLDTGKIAGGLEISHKLGNKGDVRKLTKFCDKNNIDLYLDFDVVKFNKSGASIRLKKDSAKFPNGQSVLRYEFDNVTRNNSNIRYSILAHDKLEDVVNKAKKSAQKYGINNLSFSTLSNMCYSDYSAYNLNSYNNMSNLVSGIINQISKDNKILTVGANSYAVWNSDCVIETPTSSSKYDVETEEIPFYQMVFKGYINMTGQSVNISVNPKRELLKCIESGIGPSYTIIGNYSNSLVSSRYTALYNSDFNSIKKNILKDNKKVADVLNKTNGAKILYHDIISDGIRFTKFDNGINIIVNETEKPYVYQNKTIESMNYLMWEG